MSDTTFDIDGLLAALQEALGQGPEGIGLTVRELAKKTGLCEDTSRTGLQRVAENGRLGISKKRLIRIDGISTTITAYFLKTAR